VHGIFNLVARNENVAVDVRQRHVGHNEPIPIRMVNQAAADFVTRRCFVLRNLFGCGCGRRTGRGRRVALGASQQEPLVRQRFHQPAFLQLGQHSQQRAAVTFFHMQRPRQLLQRHRIIPKL